MSSQITKYVDILPTRQQDVVSTSQVRLEWNTQRRLRGTSPRRLSGTSPWHLIGKWQRLKKTQQRRPISASLRRLKQVSNETPNDVTVVRHQDILVVRILDVPLVHLCDVSCKSQMKHSITWYVEYNVEYNVVRFHHVSELRCCDALLISLYYVFRLLCHELNPVGFHVSFKYQIKQQHFLVPTRRETKRVGL